MEIDLQRIPPVPALPANLTWVPWNELLVQSHAETLYGCFHHEIDGIVFPSLGDRVGCGRLMGEIRGKPGFLAEATWLLACDGGYCGTIQGIRERSGFGAIQNLGVLPTYRGRGLGTALLLQALHGFRRAGLVQAFLEVTAHNEGAIRLYHRLGFRRRRTLYKTTETFAVVW